MIAYKAVRKFDSKYLSFRSNYALTYKLGLTTKPIIPNSYLFCFSSKRQAIDFIFDRKHCCVLECEVEKANIDINHIPMFSYDILKYWLNKEYECCTHYICACSNKPTIDTIFPLAGTIFCSSVTPLKEVT